MQDKRLRGRTPYLTTIYSFQPSLEQAQKTAMQIVSSTLVKRFGNYRVSTGEVMAENGKAVGHWVADINGMRISEFTPAAQAYAHAEALAQTQMTRAQRKEKGAYV